MAFHVVAVHGGLHISSGTTMPRDWLRHVSARPPSRELPQWARPRRGTRWRASTRHGAHRAHQAGLQEAGGGKGAAGGGGGEDHNAGDKFLLDLNYVTIEGTSLYNIYDAISNYTSLRYRF